MDAMRVIEIALKEDKKVSDFSRNEKRPLASGTFQRCSIADDGNGHVSGWVRIPFRPVGTKCFFANVLPNQIHSSDMYHQVRSSKTDDWYVLLSVRIP